MALHPQGSVLQFHLHGRGAGVLQTLSIENSKHAIRVEGHPAFGGKDSAPSPLDYALASVAACNQVTSVIVARELGVELGAFDIDVRAELDNSVLIFGVDGESNFSRLFLEVVVETNADDATFQKLAREVERRCPLTRLFAGSGVDVVSAWRNASLAAIARAG
jgi:uncharacterized OsmC-like protein